MPTPPSLAVDLSGAQSIEYPDRGVARYTQELAAALARVPGAVAALLLNPSLPMPGGLHPELLSSPMLRWNTATEMRRLRSAGPLAYLMPSPMELGPPSATMLPPHVLEDGMPILAVLYDLIPLLAPDRHMVNRDVARRYSLRLRLYGEAARVLAISQSSADDAVRLLGLGASRITVIGGGVAPAFRPDGPATGDDTVVYVGGTADRKNVEGLIRAWARVDPGVRRGLRLAVVCSLDHQVTVERWRRLVTEAGLGGAVDLTGRLSDDDLAALLRGARLHVFPSLYEGFGLPVAEAIACRCPTITAATGATPEVLDDPTTTFDATSEAAIAAALERVLGDPGELARLRDLAALRAPLFTWEAVARRVLDALPGAPEAGQRRLRVAVGGASQALLEALVARADVRALGGSRGDGIPALPEAALTRRGLGAGYDAVVHVLGPGDADPAFPGILWLRAIRVERHDLGVSPDALRAARSVIVGSEAERRWLRLAFGPGGAPVPVHVVEARDPGAQADALLDIVAGAAA